MPAIQLTRLKHQTAQLARAFDHPALFIEKLDTLLNFYSNRTQRRGQSGEPPPLIASYNVPKPVIRQILADILPLVEDHLNATFALSDALWRVPNLEHRLIATHLIGEAPPDLVEPVLKRVVAWSMPAQEGRMIDALFEFGLNRLRRDAPHALTKQIESWINDTDLSNQKLGLLAIKPLISTTQFENLPLYFRMLAPLTRSHPQELRSELRDALQALTRRSPVETAYFLRQYLETTQSQDTAWLARQCLPFMTEETRASLRSVLRSLPEAAASQ